MELEEMVNLFKPNQPQKNDNLEEGSLTLLELSQIYDPAYEVGDATNNGICPMLR